MLRDRLDALDRRNAENARMFDADDVMRLRLSRLEDHVEALQDSVERLSKLLLDDGHVFRRLETLEGKQEAADA